jgi:hypothetical protein
VKRRVKACLKWVLNLLRQLLFECILFATLEGSPFNSCLTINSFYIKIIFLKFIFKGQEEGLGMITYQFP